MHKEAPQSFSLTLPISGCKLSIILYGIEPLSDEGVVEAYQLVIENIRYVDEDDALDFGDITIVITFLRASTFIMGFDYSGDTRGVFPQSTIYELDPDESDTAMGPLLINKAVDEFMNILLDSWNDIKDESLDIVRQNTEPLPPRTSLTMDEIIEGARHGRKGRQN